MKKSISGNSIHVLRNNVPFNKAFQFNCILFLLFIVIFYCNPVRGEDKTYIKQIGDSIIMYQGHEEYIFLEDTLKDDSARASILKKIIFSNKQNDFNILNQLKDFLPSLIALVAIIIGPLIQMKIAKKQLRGQLISQHRHNWNSDFRIKISELLNNFNNIANFSIEDLAAEQKKKLISDELKAINFNYIKLRLFLDLDKELSNSIINSIDNAVNKINEDKFEELPAIIETISDLSENILKEERRKIKKGI